MFLVIFKRKPHAFRKFCVYAFITVTFKMFSNIFLSTLCLSKFFFRLFKFRTQIIHLVRIFNRLFGGGRLILGLILRCSSRSGILGSGILVRSLFAVRIFCTRGSSRSYRFIGSRAVTLVIFTENNAVRPKGFLKSLINLLIGIGFGSCGSAFIHCSLLLLLFCAKVFVGFDNRRLRLVRSMRFSRIHNTKPLLRIPALLLFTVLQNRALLSMVHITVYHKILPFPIHIFLCNIIIVHKFILVNT
nr:MAG TPA: hypothetical protein [Caudoviricetes sp.]